MRIYFWIARITGHDYVYYKKKERDGKYRTYYLAPLHVVERLVAKGVNKAALQVSAMAKTTFSEAKELVKQLRDFVAELRARIKRDLEAVEAGIDAIAASTIADAVALEVAVKGRSGIMGDIWDIVVDYLQEGEERARALLERLLRKLRSLVEEDVES